LVGLDKTLTPDLINMNADQLVLRALSAAR